jgi:hypothetical protein
MSGWGEFGKKKRRWPHGVNRVIEEALQDAEPAAEWLRTHPPGARLPDNLESGYEPDEYEPESKGTDELWKAQARSRRGRISRATLGKCVSACRER